MGQKWRHGRDDSGSMLATVIVVVAGAGLCCFIVLAGDSQQSETLLHVIGGFTIIVLAQMFRYRYGGQGGSSLAFWNAAARNRRDDGVHEYEPRIKDSSSSRREAGSNQPITASEARELQTQSSRTWVPSRARTRKRRK